MQPIVLVISLVLMTALGAVFLRAVLATESAPAPETTNRLRSQLIWGLVVLGFIVTLGSLREWPHLSASGNATIVNITGAQWSWETDTEEVVAGTEVEFRVTTEDVTHGLGIYDPDMRLLAQVQSMPGYTATLVHTFEEPGLYRLLCMELCGVGHHDMANEFNVLEAKQ